LREGSRRAAVDNFFNGGAIHNATIVYQLMNNKEGAPC